MRFKLAHRDLIWLDLR